MKKTNASKAIAQYEEELRILEARKLTAQKVYEQAMAEYNTKTIAIYAAIAENKNAPKRELETVGNFQETREKITVTFGGWDGKSYNGEPVTLRVWTHLAHSEVKFVKRGKAFHRVLDSKHDKSGHTEVTYHCDTVTM